MLPSTEWNVLINLRSMARAIAAATLAGQPSSSGAVDMSKPNLQLIHSSSSIPPRANRRQGSRSFRPPVIEGGVRSAPGELCWEAALELFDLSLLVFHQNYFAFLEAHMAVFWDLHRKGPEKTG
jgi:hypothetical protein